MDCISEEVLMRAEDFITSKIIVEYNIGLDKLALDYTNYFTYISTENEDCKLAKRGRNKQKRHDLRQCSLTVVTTKEAGIPLFSHVYEGNTNDQTEFKEYLPLLEKRMPGTKFDEITLIFDGGSVTKKNLEDIKTHYICSFSLSYCKELYEIDIKDYDMMIINGKKVKYHRTDKNIWGKQRTCLLTLSQKLYNGQLRELNDNIAKAIKELDELNIKINNCKSRIDKTEEGIKKRIAKILKQPHLSEIIYTEFINNKVVYIVVDTMKTGITKKYFGKKLTITDLSVWTTDDILKSYNEQDCIERIFRDTKDTEHFSLRPIYHWTDQKIRVHIFICLLGLTLSAILQKEMQNRGIDISKDKLLKTLSSIRQSWVKENVGNKVTKVLEKMDDMQSKLWEAINSI
jgi:transposase